MHTDMLAVDFGTSNSVVATLNGDAVDCCVFSNRKIADAH